MPASVEFSRWRWRRRANATLKDFWSAPLPSRRADWRDAEFLVLDAEMSSLDPNQGELLSLGWVTVSGGSIALDTARGKMYWADPGSSKVQRANLDGTGLEDLVTTGLDVPLGIALDVSPRIDVFVASDR